MKLWRKQPKKDLGAEVRLAEAESRVDRLMQRARVLAFLSAKRDAENHWQESVNRLILGDK